MKEHNRNYLKLTDPAWFREHVLGVAMAEDLADPEFLKPNDRDYAVELTQDLSGTFPRFSADMELGPDREGMRAFCQRTAAAVTALRRALSERVQGKLTDAQLEQDPLWRTYPEYFEQPPQHVLRTHQLAQAMELTRHRLRVAKAPAVPKPLPQTSEAVQAAFDELMRSNHAVTIRARAEDTDPAVVWEAVGDPERNWLYVVLYGPNDTKRRISVTDDPGFWSVATLHQTGTALATRVARKLCRQLVAKLETGESER